MQSLAINLHITALLCENFPFSPTTMEEGVLILLSSPNEAGFVIIIPIQVLFGKLYYLLPMEQSVLNSLNYPILHDAFPLL